MAYTHCRSSCKCDRLTLGWQGRKTLTNPDGNGHGYILQTCSPHFLLTDHLVCEIIASPWTLLAPGTSPCVFFRWNVSIAHRSLQSISATIRSFRSQRICSKNAKPRCMATFRRKPLDSVKQCPRLVPEKGGHALAGSIRTRRQRALSEGALKTTWCPILTW